MSRILVGGKSEQLAPLLSRIRTAAGLSRVAVGRPQLDLENPGTVESVVRAVEPSAIINAAAYTAVDQAESEPERAFAVNRDGAERLASEAQRRAVSFIHISTDYANDIVIEEIETRDRPVHAVLVGFSSIRIAVPAASNETTPRYGRDRTFISRELEITDTQSLNRSGYGDTCCRSRIQIAWTYEKTIKVQFPARGY